MRSKKKMHQRITAQRERLEAIAGVDEVALLLDIASCPSRYKALGQCIKRKQFGNEILLDFGDVLGPSAASGGTAEEPIGPGGTTAGGTAREIQNAINVTLNTSEADIDQECQRRFGFAPRPLQKEVVAGVLRMAGRKRLEDEEEGRKPVCNGVLLIAPTNFGKTMAMVLPFLLWRRTNPTSYMVLLTPLVALGEEQEAKLPANAVFLQGGRAIPERLDDKEVLIMTPEKMAASGHSIRRLLQQRECFCVAIDEIHVALEATDRFRPEYLKLGKLMAPFNPLLVMGCSATLYDTSVFQGMEDIMWSRYAANLDRPDIEILVRKVHSSYAEVLRHHSPSMATIIFCATRGLTEELAEAFSAPYYHGESSTTAPIEGFRSGGSKWLFMTSAGGLGMNLAARAVFSVGLPLSREQAAQFAGRLRSGGVFTILYRDDSIEQSKRILRGAPIHHKKRSIDLYRWATDDKTCRRIWLFDRPSARLERCCDVCSGGSYRNADTTTAPPSPRPNETLPQNVSTDEAGNSTDANTVTGGLSFTPVPIIPLTGSSTIAAAALLLSAVPAVRSLQLPRFSGLGVIHRFLEFSRSIDSTSFASIVADIKGSPPWNTDRVGDTDFLLEDDMEGEDDPDAMVFLLWVLDESAVQIRDFFRVSGPGVGDDPLVALPLPMEESGCIRIADQTRTLETHGENLLIVYDQASSPSVEIIAPARLAVKNAVFHLIGFVEFISERQHHITYLRRQVESSSGRIILGEWTRNDEETTTEIAEADLPPHISRASIILYLQETRVEPPPRLGTEAAENPAEGHQSDDEDSSLDETERRLVERITPSSCYSVEDHYEITRLDGLRSFLISEPKLRIMIYVGLFISHSSVALLIAPRTPTSAESTAPLAQTEAH